MPSSSPISDIGQDNSRGSQLLIVEQHQQPPQPILGQASHHNQQQQLLVEVQGNSMDENLDDLTASSQSFNIINKTSASENNINNTTITTTNLNYITTFTNAITKDPDNNISKSNIQKDVESTPNTNDNIFTDNNSTSTNSIESSKTENDNATQATSFIKTNANFSAAANIANSFINLTNLHAANTVSNTIITNTLPTNLNVIVSKPKTHQFMKTFAISKVTKPGIIVPNILAPHMPSQFSKHPQYGIHSSSDGPAPNVTVNPNGNFNTGSCSVLRPAFNSSFRPFIHNSTSSINFNLKNTNNIAVKSPILAAQLQTINTLASNNNSQQNQSSVGSLHYQISNPSTDSNILSVKISSPIHTNNESTTITMSKSQSPINLASPQLNNASTHSSPRSLTPHCSMGNDNQIRVLTPSEIMRTLPSLPNQDVVGFENINPSSVKSNSCIGNSNTQHQTLQIVNNSSANNTTSQCVFSTIEPPTNLITTSTVTTSTSNVQQIMVRDVWSVIVFHLKNVEISVFFF